MKTTKKIKIELDLEEVQSGQYYLKSTRLGFDAPYAIYVVNGDRHIPYYRVHINGQLVAMLNYEREAEEFLMCLVQASDEQVALLNEKAKEILNEKKNCEETKHDKEL